MKASMGVNATTNNLRFKMILRLKRNLRNLNSFHEAGPVDQAVRAGFEEWLQHALELNGGVKTELADFKLVWRITLNRNMALKIERCYL